MLTQLIKIAQPLINAWRASTFQPNIPYRTDSHFSEKNAKLLSKAQVSIDNEKFKDAEKKLEVLEKRNLNDFEQALVYFLNGQIAAKRGMSGDAIEQYRRISSLNQNNIPLAFEREVDLAALQLHFKASSIDVIVSEVLSWCAKPATDKTVARNLLLNLYGQLGLQSEVEALNAVVPSGDYLPLVKIAPDYPLGAQQKGISGYCVIEYTVSRTGAVVDRKWLKARVNMLDSLPNHQLRLPNNSNTPLT